MNQPHTSWTGQTIAQRYKMETRLGQGGMSTVYEATDLNLKRKVAVKLIHPHLSDDPEFVRRFELEAEAVAKLNHPNIIQVYDFDHDRNVYYMVLEYIPGQSLQEKLKQLSLNNERMPLDETIRTMITLCDAVDFAHQRDMVHRDLKPANVMINERGRPVLMDFGVAKMIGHSELTQTGAVIGSIAYMSPEQAQGQRPDERADIYSLGVILYEMTAGKPPFEGDSAITIMMKHINEPVPDVQKIVEGVPDHLAAIIQAALAKDPTERYQSAADMAAALRGVIGQDVPGGLPETVIQEKSPVAAKSSRLSPVMIAIAALVLLVIIGGGAFWWFSNQGSNASEAAAESPFENMVRIVGGTYSVGLDIEDGQHVPPQRVQIPDFWIDRFEVTNAQYGRFLRQDGREPPNQWSGGNIPAGKEDFPVQGVTWDDAVAFCTWADKRLPTEAEWEIAARGPDGLSYPWGEDVSVADLPRSETYLGGERPINLSPFGVYDMAGNVWEWVDDSYAFVPAGLQILRGGAYGLVRDMAYRLPSDSSVATSIATAGIRCAKDWLETDITFAEPIQEQFIDPNSGWQTQEQAIYLVGYHPPDFYHVEVNQTNSKSTVFQGQNFDDFTMEIEVLFDHTTTPDGQFRYGALARYLGDNQYYAFMISPRTKQWQVIKQTPQGEEVLAQDTSDNVQGMLIPNTLRIDAKGGELTFHLDNQPIAQIQDAIYGSGQVGFIVETMDETLAHVHYDSLTIREAETGAVVLNTVALAEEPTATGVEETTEETETPTVAAVEEDSDTPTATMEPTATEAAATDTPSPAPTETDTPEVATSTPTSEPTATEAVNQTPSRILAESLQGTIAYPAFNGRSYDLYFADVASGESELYRAGASQPAFNSDGSEIVFVSWAGGSRGLVSSLTGSGNEVLLSNSALDKSPSFDVDGESVLFSARGVNGDASQIFRIASNLEFFENSRQQLAEGAYPSANASGVVALQSTDPVTPALQIGSADLADVETLSFDEPVYAPALSPDGSQVAFMSNPNENWDIYIVNADGTDLKRLTTDPTREGLPVWSPDGLALAFATNRSGFWNIWAMTPTGSGQTKLFDMEGSPDGIVLQEEDNSGGWLDERLSWVP